jgi:hypothetical protein
MEQHVLHEDPCQPFPNNVAVGIVLPEQILLLQSQQQCLHCLPAHHTSIRKPDKNSVARDGD